MASKLVSYNSALGQHLSERKLASLSENVEPRRVLDDFWDKAVAEALEQGFWNFAMRTVEITASTSVEPAFGLTYAFQKPTDWVRTVMVSANDRFEPPLQQFNDESGYLYADVAPLYWRYISNDSAYGLDLSLWPESFTKYVEVVLARMGCMRITKDKALRDDLIKIERMYRADARSKDAMNEPPGQMPAGSWVRSRGSSSGYDRVGNRLIG